MNEARFRQLMRAAVGDGAMPQWLATDVRNRLRAPQGTVRPRLLALAAMGVAFVVLVTGVLELQHLARQQSPPPVPAATPSASASPSPVAVPQRPDRMTMSVVADRTELNIRRVTGKWSEGELGGRGRSSAPGAGARIDQPPSRVALQRIQADEQAGGVPSIDIGKAGAAPDLRIGSLSDVVDVEH